MRRVASAARGSAALMRARGPRRGSEPHLRDAEHASSMRDDERGTPGTRAVFAVCLTVIAIGLTIMIVLPLVGR
ncbi:hypothetical protein SAMN04487783_1166 [Agrococcus baldri]|uniref:Uncharacterized protein n=1 Tax=Agrococcus baldri TaxID=153730 RepID=A0AA94HLR7_9MICO|nr:hypothetical protein SAMN04487783_1166 [Agrococcus baldri]